MTTTQEILRQAELGCFECKLYVDNWPTDIIQRLTTALEDNGFKVELNNHAKDGNAAYFLEISWGEPSGHTVFH